MTWGRARGWRPVAVAVVVLGVASLLSNIITAAQLAGHDQVFFGVRRTASLLLNSGTAWAGISVLAGWWQRRPATAALAGLAAGTSTLAVHYGLGELTGLMPSDSFTANAPWFVIAGVTGAPLGLIGALAHSPTRWGLAARLVVPAGAVLEPFVVGWWSGHDDLRTAARASNLAAAIMLTAAGLVGGWFAIRRHRGQGRRHSARAETRANAVRPRP